MIKMIIYGDLLAIRKEYYEPSKANQHTRSTHYTSTFKRSIKKLDKSIPMLSPFN